MVRVRVDYDPVPRTGPYHNSLQTTPSSIKPGQWSSIYIKYRQAYLTHIISQVDAISPPAKLSPELEELKALIEEDPRIYMYFQGMFDEAPRQAPFWRDPLGVKLVRDWEHVLRVLNWICSKAPEWSVEGCVSGLLGVPMHALFAYAMGTPSGHAAFLDKDVNRVLKKILNSWGKYLTTPESAYVLGDCDNGWFGERAMRDLVETANAPYKTSLRFEQIFVCDPSAKHYGFKSWDDFFTRKIRDSARPVASPEDKNIIANACESKVYNISLGANLRDRFFAKGEPYSVLDMLAHDPLAEHFAGCTVYQAYLSPLAYHRWHSPVSGTVRRAFVQDGTYFSQPYYEGEAPDSDRLTGAQAYLSALATRAVVMIEADNPAIGLMAFIGIGMDEVSTCEITAREGQHVRKGDDIGMFHYGGSSHCLLFRKGVRLEEWPEIGREENVPVRGKLAVVKRDEGEEVKSVNITIELW